MSLGVIRPQSCLSKKKVQINWQKESKSTLTGFWKLNLPTVEGGLNQETSPYFSESSKSCQFEFTNFFNSFKGQQTSSHSESLHG